MLTGAISDVFFEDPAAQSTALSLLSQKQGQEWAVSEGKVIEHISTCTFINTFMRSNKQPAHITSIHKHAHSQQARTHTYTCRRCDATKTHTQAHAHTNARIMH